MRWLALFTVFLCGFTQADEMASTHFLIVQPSSTLTIDGKTSVNKFQCAITRYTASDTLILTAQRGKGAVFSKGLVHLAASEFDCGMKAMTNDFGKTIHADEFPFITIDFVSFTRAPRFEDDTQKFKGQIKISLSNTTVPFDVRCSIEKDEQGFFHLKGTRDFLFSDFNLKPPSKMMGLVKVDEDLTVNFHLILRKK